MSTAFTTAVRAPRNRKLESRRRKVKLLQKQVNRQGKDSKLLLVSLSQSGCITLSGTESIARHVSGNKEFLHHLDELFSVPPTVSDESPKPEDLAPGVTLESIENMATKDLRCAVSQIVNPGNASRSIWGNPHRKPVWFPADVPFVAPATTHVKDGKSQLFLQRKELVACLRAYVLSRDDANDG